ncbi:MAG: hypothetical protein HWN79_04220 [Candidatus Lokiarchaeota archaeon]|nr:hypothetical protein [Candidatus Lokiarchaeota archaeon]
MPIFGRIYRCNYCNNQLSIDQYFNHGEICNNCISNLERKMDSFQRLLLLSDKDIRLEVIHNNSSATLKENNHWKIEYNHYHPIYELIHELGHIFIYKKTDYIHFAQQPEASISDQIEKVFYYSNHLIDCFVDYNLSNFTEIYVSYVDYIKEIMNGMKGIDTNHEFYELLGGFLKFYISCRYILKNEEKGQLQINIEEALTNLENVILRKSNNNKNLGLIDYLNEKNLLEIKTLLNNFDVIKDTDDNSVIKNFVYNIFKLIPFMENDNLTKKFKLIYP